MGRRLRRSRPGLCHRLRDSLISTTSFPGARYQRQAGSVISIPILTTTSRPLPTTVHYQGNDPWTGNLVSGDAGGGHAHAGAMIYLGGAWPEEVSRSDIHEQYSWPANQYRHCCNPMGRGLFGRARGLTFLLTGDIASQILNLRYGPDGNVYVIDWYDTNACHHGTMLPGMTAAMGGSTRLSMATPGQRRSSLAERKRRGVSGVSYFTRTIGTSAMPGALLQERHATARRRRGRAQKRWRDIAGGNDDPTRQLRAMWALHATGGVPSDDVA